MAEGNRLPHLGIPQQFSSEFPYTGKSGRGKVPAQGNRVVHGARIRQQFQEIQQQLNLSIESLLSNTT